MNAPSYSRDENALNAIRVRLEAAENAGDADAIGRMLADDAVIMVPSEPVQEGREACAAFVRRMLAETLGSFNRRISYVSAEVRVVDNVAFDQGVFSFTVQPKSGGEASTVTGKYLWLYTRSADRGWKIARLLVCLDEENREDC